MMVRPMLVTASVCAVALGVFACSSSTPPAGKSSAGSPEASAPAATAAKPAVAPHGCTLLKAQDAEAVLGAGARLNRDSENSCILETPNPLGPVVEVKIERLSDVWDAGETMMKFDKTARQLPEIGDGGYTYMGGSIVFKKGAWEVSVITSAYKGDKTQFDAAKLIAERVAAAM